MSLWPWLAALLLYAAFAAWYHNWRGALRPEEVELYLRRWQELPAPPAPELLGSVRRFLESDDGGAFFMLNLIRLQPGEVAVPGSDAAEPAQKLLRRYTGYFMPRVFRRAGHPAFIGPAAGRYLEHWGVEPDPGWTFAGIVRYRSRRDLIELATDPRFAPAHAYKLAAIAQTLAFPVAPARLFFGPAAWMALLLALAAALAQLALRAR